MITLRLSIQIWGTEWGDTLRRGWRRVGSKRGGGRGRYGLNILHVSVACRLLLIVVQMSLVSCILLAVCSLRRCWLRGLDLLLQLLCQYLGLLLLLQKLLLLLLSHGGLWRWLNQLQWLLDHGLLRELLLGDLLGELLGELLIRNSGIGYLGLEGLL